MIHNKSVILLSLLVLAVNTDYTKASSSVIRNNSTLTSTKRSIKKPSIKVKNSSLAKTSMDDKSQPTIKKTNTPKRRRVVKQNITQIAPMNGNQQQQTATPENNEKLTQTTSDHANLEKTKLEQLKFEQSNLEQSNNPANSEQVTQANVTTPGEKQNAEQTAQNNDVQSSTDDSQKPAIQTPIPESSVTQSQASQETVKPSVITSEHIVGETALQNSNGQSLGSQNVTSSASSNGIASILSPIIENTKRIENKIGNMEESNRSIVNQLGDLEKKIEEIKKLDEMLEKINDTTAEVNNDMKQIVNAINEGKERTITNNKENLEKKNNRVNEEDTDELEDILNDASENTKQHSKNTTQKTKPRQKSLRKKISLLTDKDFQEIFELAKGNSEENVKNDDKVSSLLNASTVSKSDKTRIKSCIKLGQKVQNEELSEDDAKKQLQVLSDDVNDESEIVSVEKNTSNDEKKKPISSDNNDDFDNLDDVLDLNIGEKEDKYAVDELLNEEKDEHKNDNEDNQNSKEITKSSANGKCTIKLNVKQNDGEVKQTCAEELIDKTLKVVNEHEEGNDIEDLLS